MWLLIYGKTISIKTHLNLKMLYLACTVGYMIGIAFCCSHQLWIKETSCLPYIRDLTQLLSALCKDTDQ